MKGSLRLGRIAGIEIGVHYTWLLAFVVIVWSLARGYFPQQYPGWSEAAYGVTAVIAALLLFAAVLVHELAHSLVATARGLPVASITLFIFGGVSNMSREANRPGTEFIMAIAGPAASVVIAGVCFGLWYVVELRTGPLAAMLFYLASINALLAGFNLLPGFPLDGGRVLRSIIWAISGNFARATRIAAMVGRVLAWGLIIYGVYEVLTGNLLSGLWIGLIGWFLNGAADASSREVTLESQFSGVKVRDIMDPNPDTVRPDTRVSEAVREVFLQRGHRAAPVIDAERLVGIVTLNDVKHLPQEKWLETPVSQVMTRAPLHTVDPDDDLNSAFRLLAQYSVNQVLVAREGRLLGLLSRAHIIHYLQVSQELEKARRKA